MTEVLSARSEILARIRSITGRATPLPSAEVGWQSIPRNYIQASVLGHAECIDLLVERLGDYGADVSQCDAVSLAGILADILSRRNKKRMLVSREIDLAWLTAEGRCTFVRDEELSYSDLDACDGVLTGCTAAIAGTGTLVLCHDAERGRRAVTLIPDYHLCVVRACDVVETVPEAMRVLEPYKTQPITLISGPSATADIEMTRIQGVHGPRVLDVVIVT